MVTAVRLDIPYTPATTTTSGYTSFQVVDVRPGPDVVTCVNLYTHPGHLTDLQTICSANPRHLITGDFNASSNVRSSTPETPAGSHLSEELLMNRRNTI